MLGYILLVVAGLGLGDGSAPTSAWMADEFAMRRQLYLNGAFYLTLALLGRRLGHTTGLACSNAGFVLGFAGPAEAT